MARLIDADELHKKFFKEFDHNCRLVGKQNVARAWQGAMQLLYDAPTIEAEPVTHGKWEYSHQDDHSLCSVCGYEHYRGSYHQYERNYCPNCGARMDGGAEK